MRFFQNGGIFFDNIRGRFVSFLKNLMIKFLEPIPFPFFVFSFEKVHNQFHIEEEIRLPAPIPSINPTA